MRNSPNRILYLRKTFFFAVVFFLLHAGANCQNKEEKARNYKVTRFNSTESKRKEIVFDFKNINRQAFYSNPALLGKIKTLEAKKDYANLLQAYEEYVGNFGIQNFYKNTDMLWKLGQLYEIYKEVEKAKAMYRLSLKHHRQAVDQIKIHYDTLTKMEKEYYVPLKYYYELVEYRKAIDTLRPPKSVLLNMGSEVNSKYEDYGPTMHSVDNFLLFTSQRKIEKNGSGKKDEDIYLTRNYDGFWDTAEPFTAINTRYNEGSACLSKDGKTIIFSRCNAPGGYGNCDLYISKLQEDSTWTKPQNLGLNVNSKAWDSQPSLSHTEDTLYFSSDRLGGFGLTDIYFSYRDGKGGWARAQNLGPVINTRDSEVSPFFHPQYNALYFSSKGQLLQFGDFDIYKSYLVNGVFQEPRSIGPLVNGAASEYYFTIDGKSKDLFYAKAEKDDPANLDLHSFPLPMEAQPNADTRLGGSLVDSLTGEPFQGIVSVIDLDNGIEVAPKFLRPNGTFDFDLINKNNYLLIIQGEDFFRIEKKIHLDGDTSINIRTPSINFKRLKFTSLEFDHGSAELKADMHRDLDRLYNYLLDNPKVRVKISGHTNTDGNPKDNMVLSQKRADAIKEYLVEFGGIEPDRIDAKGYGDTKPLIQDQSEQALRINKRVEFEFIKPEEPPVNLDNTPR